MKSCIFCQQFEEVWESVIKDLPSRVSVSRIDVNVPRKMTKVEEAGLQVMGETVPSIVLVDERVKPPRALKFAGIREKEKIHNWINTHMEDRDSVLLKLSEIKGHQ